MGRFVNPDSSAFQVALNSRIYVDKTGLIEYTNSVLDTTVRKVLCSKHAGGILQQGYGFRTDVFRIEDKQRCRFQEAP